jgi:hypothetical protein
MARRVSGRGRTRRAYWLRLRSSSQWMPTEVVSGGTPGGRVSSANKISQVCKQTLKILWRLEA